MPFLLNGRHICWQRFLSALPCLTYLDQIIYLIKIDLILIVLNILHTLEGTTLFHLAHSQQTHFSSIFMYFHPYRLFCGSNDF